MQFVSWKYELGILVLKQKAVDDLDLSLHFLQDAFDRLILFSVANRIRL